MCHLANGSGLDSSGTLLKLDTGTKPIQSPCLLPLGVGRRQMKAGKFSAVSQAVLVHVLLCDKIQTSISPDLALSRLVFFFPCPLA